MATGGGPRDLNVKLTLDTSHFTQNQQLLKTQLSALKSDFKSVAANSDFVGQSDALKQNLLDQMTAVETQIANYKLKLTELEGQLEGKEKGSAGESYILRQMNQVSGSISNSKTALSALEEQMKTFNAGNFAAAMQELSSVVNGLDMAYNTLLGGWAKDSADSAYEIAASREKVTKEMYKIAGEDAGLEWLQQTEAQVRQAILEIPVTYEHFMTVMANAMQAGGQSYQDAFRFAEIFTKLESAAPTLAGDEGIAGFSRYLTLMDVQAAEYEKIASVVVELGNNFAVTEDVLVDTANRAASGLRAAGINAVDGLAVVAAGLATGMNEAATATSLEKLSGSMAKSAAVATDEYAELIEMLQAYDEAYYSAEVFKAAADLDGEAKKGLMEMYGLTSSDLDQMIKNAMTAEKFASTMGMTVQEYGAWFSSDPARAMIDFFGMLGQMDAEGSESILSYLDYLGITEVRSSRLAKSFALSNEQVARALGISRDAAAEGAALQREYGAMGDAEVSNQVRRKNAQENALADLGNAVTAVRKPFQDFFADVQQGFTNLPEWAKNAAGGLLEVFGGIGTVLSSVGDVAGGLYYSGELIKNVKSADWSKIGGGLKTAASAVGKFALPVAAAAGIAALISTLDTMANDATIISERLAAVEINVDENSKNATLAAIAEVKRAAAELSGEELSEAYAGTSAVVKQGYGTFNMFGQALGYEQEKAEREAEAIYADYGQRLQQLQQQLLASTTSGEKDALQAQIRSTEAAMKAAIAANYDSYTRELNALVNGAIAQQEGASERLAAISRKYNAIKLLYQYNALGEGTKERREFWETYVNELSATAREAGVSLLDYKWANVDVVGATQGLYKSVADDVAAIVGEEGGLMGIMSAVLSSGSLENADLTALQGNMEALFQALDFYQIAQKGAGNWRDIGAYSMTGLAAGTKDARGRPISEIEEIGSEMLAAIRAVLDIHSPSRAFAEIGQNAVQGLAAGILAQESAAVAAIRQIGAAMQAEAAAQAGRISALLQLGGYGVSAGLQGGFNAPSSGGSQITNHFNISAGSLAEQQSVISLADRIQRIQYRTNAGVGKFK